MKLTILGSGTFFVTDTVSASAFVLEAVGKKILVDCGPGTLVKLAQAGFKIEDLDYVFITHFHPDHSSDLYPLFMNYSLGAFFTPSNDKKMPVFCGPIGLDAFMLAYSNLVELPAYANQKVITVQEYDKKIEIDGITVTPFKVDHNAFGVDARAYSLRFEAEGKVITFSGDTLKCDGVQDSCKNADLFVCDCSFPKTMKTKAHMNTTEIGEIATKGNVRKLLLDHFYPQFSNVDMVAEVAEVYKGEIIKAKDLEAIEV